MYLGYILVLLSAFGFGVLPIFAVFAYESEMNVPTLLFLRFTFSSIFFFTYIFLKRVGWKVTKKQLLSLFLLGGVLYTMQSTFYFSAVKYIPASLAVLLLYLFPIIVAILSFFINKERLSLRLIISIVISLAGILLILGSPSGDVNVLGIILAIGAAITYSVYILLGNRITEKLPPVVTSGFVALFACSSFLTYGLSTQSIQFNFAPSGWFFALGVALFSTVLSIFTFFVGMKLIGPTKASILSMVEPVITTIFSTLLLNDSITLLQMFGGVIVLTGATLVFLAKEKDKVEVDGNVSTTTTTTEG